MNRLEKAKGLYLYDKKTVENFKKETSNYDVLNYIYKIEYENVYLSDENTNLKQGINEIREYIDKHKLDHRYNSKSLIYGQDILQIIDKVLGDDEK